ncbi:MAG: ImmA/IrrE family metallo-endopeptidase [Methanobrevibacter olleyae]|uniref:ImmA/IrrE family metallo-endopeptidase n=1 Tax=Methanobrevibacter olleyae TaxID=294671 RepID=A0A8T3VMX0_METOL|nr:ImmA/IrrE family metallo-endopeptidase [Methanobrevibacter olleyae]
MSTEVIQANKNWLVWARESVNYDKKTVAQKMRIKEETLDNWEKTGQLKYNDIIKLSKIYHIAPHLFFNANDPVYEKPFADFRTVKNKKVKSSSKIVFELRNAKARRETLLDIEEDDEDFIIPDFKLKDCNVNTIDEAIEAINNFVRLNTARRKNFTTDDWIIQIEKLGILVFQFYEIPPEDLRGYVIYYDKLPIIGINHQESDNAKKFTLFHELAHILLKKEGLSNFYSLNIKDYTEVKCNAIAGEILIPSTVIKQEVENRNVENFTDEKLIKELSKKYGVSNEVIVRKFLNENFITKKEYEKFKEKLNKFIFDSPKTESKRPPRVKKELTPEEINENKIQGDRRIARKTITKNGEYYINSLIYAYMNDIITDLDFARNLDVSLRVVKFIIQIMLKED